MFRVFAILVCLVVAFGGCRRPNEVVPQESIPAKAADAAEPDAKDRVAIQATITEFSPGSMWTHFEDDGFEVNDATTFTVTRPDYLKGEEMTVYFDGLENRKEPWLEKVGSVCTFLIDKQTLDDQFNPSISQLLYVDALEELTLIEEAPRQ